MVLSLAFILAFIGSAVALLIGILIFSEVQNDMLTSFGDPIQIGVVGSEEILSKNGGLDSLGTRGHTTLSQEFARGNVQVVGACYNSGDGLTIGSEITEIRVEKSFASGGLLRLGIYDGGNLVAQTGLVSSGVGAFWHTLETPYEIQVGDVLCFGGVSQTGSGITFLRAFTNGFSGFAVEHVNLLDLRYPDLPPIYVGSAVSLTSGTSFGFELKQVTEIPVFESQVPDSFNQASNIAFTVIAVIPVALFFVLFAIFGGRTE